MLGRPADASTAGLGLALSFMSVGVGSYTRHYPVQGGLEIEWRIESSGEARTLILSAVEAGASRELTRFMLDQGRREMLVPFERDGRTFAIAVGVRFDKAGQSAPYDQDLAGIASGNTKYQGSHLEIGSPMDAIRPAHTSTWGSLKAIYR